MLWCNPVEEWSICGDAAYPRREADTGQGQPLRNKEYSGRAASDRSRNAQGHGLVFPRILERVKYGK